MKQADHPFHI